MAANARTYTGGNWIVTVGDSQVAMVKKVEGFAMEAEIATADMGPNQWQSKSVANIKWTPCKLTVGTAMGKHFADWVKSALNLKHIQKNGSIITGDADHNAQTELSFTGALLTGFNVPKLAGDAKEGLNFECEFQAEQVRWAPGKGKIDGAKYGVKHKAHLASNWSLDVPGLPCNRIASVESLNWKLACTPDALGTTKEPTLHPAKVTTSDLKFSVSMADYEPWAKKAHDWFVTGHHLDKDELDCTLTLLGPDLKLKVATIELKRCGFKKFTKGALEANSDKVARFDVEMYVEQLDLTIHEFDA